MLEREGRRRWPQWSTMGTRGRWACVSPGTGWPPHLEGTEVVEWTRPDICPPGPHLIFRGGAWQPWGGKMSRQGWGLWLSLHRCCQATGKSDRFRPVPCSCHHLGPKGVLWRLEAGRQRKMESLETIWLLESYYSNFLPTLKSLLHPLLPHPNESHTIVHMGRARKGEHLTFSDTDWGPHFKLPSRYHPHPAQSLGSGVPSNSHTDTDTLFPTRGYNAQCRQKYIW